MKTMYIRYDGWTPSALGDAVSGQVNTLRCSFSFSADWDAYKNRKAIFETDDAKKEESLDENGSCLIPRAVLMKRGKLKISAYGTETGENGELLRYNGRPVEIIVDLGGNVDGESTDDPVYPQIGEAVLYTAQSLTEAQKAQARANIGAGTPYTLPEASSDALGGIKADAAETSDTQPVRIGEDGKLYTAPGGDTSIGITGASAGKIPKVKSVDKSGAPTEWTAEADTTPFIVKIGGSDYNGYTSSHTYDEIVAAANAGRVVMAYTDYIDFPQTGQGLYGAYFDLISTQDVAIFVYIDPLNVIKYTFVVDPFSISASAAYLSATSSTFGGVKADSAESSDTQPVRIGGDGKLYTAPSGGADISLGISGATAGQMAKIKSVNASGAPTAWEAGDAASGGDGWTEIGELTVGGTKFIISDYTDGVITVTPDNGIYPSVGSRAYVIRKPDYSAYINARLVATGTEGKFTLVNLDNGAYKPSEDLTQYVIDATDAWGELAFSNLPSFSYFKIRITTPLLSSHGSRTTIEILGKIQFLIGTSCSNLTGGAVEAIIETDESPVSGKDYVKASFKGKKPDRSNGYDVIDFVSKSTSDSIKIKHFSGLMVSGTNVKLWGRN